MATRAERLQVLSLLLPALKCALCPACLSLYGGLFAGARFGAAGVYELPSSLLAVVLVVDFAVLLFAFREHRRSGPLWSCTLGGGLMIVGHVTAIEVLEFMGLGTLIVTSLWNWQLLRKHHRSHHSPDCGCGHSHHNHSLARSAVNDATGLAKLTAHH